MDKDLSSLKSAVDIAADIFEEAANRAESQAVAGPLKKLWDDQSWNPEAIETAIRDSIGGNDNEG